MGRCLRCVELLYPHGCCDVTMGTIATPLDLERNVVLERLELSVQFYSLPKVYRWVHRTLRTITSPLFNEFVFWILSTTFLWNPSYPISAETVDRWKAVDALLNALAERSPDFRVVVRGDSSSTQCHGTENDHGAVRWFTENYLPLISSKGLVKFEYVPHVENRFWKSHILQTLPVPRPIPAGDG